MFSAKPAPEVRAAFLETIAANILALGDELVDRAVAGIRPAARAD